MTPIMWWGLIASDFLAKPAKLARQFLASSRIADESRARICSLSVSFVRVPLRRGIPYRDSPDAVCYACAGLVFGGCWSWEGVSRGPEGRF